MDLDVQQLIARCLRAGESTSVITKALHVSRKSVKTARDMLTQRETVEELKDRKGGEKRRR